METIALRPLTNRTVPPRYHLLFSATLTYFIAFRMLCFFQEGRKHFAFDASGALNANGRNAAETHARILLSLMLKEMQKMNPVVHFEMPYDDPKRLAKFYREAFGWQMEELGDTMGHYVLATTTETDKDRMIKTPGAINGGFFPKRPDLPAPQPSVVIAVTDIREAMKNVASAGGKVFGEPMEISGIGLYVSFMDTEGNRASMLQPAKPM